LEETFDAMIKKKCKSHIFLPFYHIFVPISTVVKLFPVFAQEIELCA